MERRKLTTRRRRAHANRSAHSQGDSEPEPRKPRSKARKFTFTDITLRRLKKKDRQYTVWDTGTKGQIGLGLLVSPGGAKTFRSIYYFRGSSKPHSRKIGRFPEMSIGDAREQVREDRRKARKGVDPKINEQRPDGMTVEQVIDQFIAHYAKPRQRTWPETQRVLLSACRDWLNMPITAITKRQAYELLDSYIAEDKPYKASVTLTWLRTMWRWAWKRDLVDTPLMDAVDIHIERRERDRVFSDDEVRAIWQAADKLGKVEGSYVKLLLLLAPRKTALANMRLKDFDDAANPTLWTTPHEFTKSRKMTTGRKRVYVTPLPPLAQRILKGLTRAEDDAEDGNDPDRLVFPGRYKGRPLNPGQWLIKDLRQHGAPKDFTYHTVRHTVATWLQNKNYSEFERGLILNHAGGGSVTSAYSHGYPLELKRKLLEEWAQHVEEIVSPEGVTVLR